MNQSIDIERPKLATTPEGDEARRQLQTIEERVEHLQDSLRSAVKVAVHRLCKCYREQVAQSVAEPADIESELRHLCEVASTASGASPSTAPGPTSPAASPFKLSPIGEKGFFRVRIED